MKPKKEKVISLNDLARMIQGEFTDIHQEFSDVHKEFSDIHQEFSDVHQELVKVNQILKLFNDRFEKIEADVHDIKTVLGPLVHSMASQERELQNLKARLSRVEREVGILP